MGSEHSEIRGATLNKKGFIYVITAGLLISVLLVVFYFEQDFSFSESVDSDLRRINLANDFVAGFNQDIERSLAISSFRSMVALEEHISATGEFLNDTQLAFVEVVETGLINGSSYNIMHNSSLDDYLLAVNNVADKLGLKINVSINNIELSHFDPWNLQVSINASILIEDRSDLAYWSYVEVYESIVPIENLRDPLYSVNTKSRVSNTIRQYPNETLVVDEDISNFVDFVDNSYYLSSSSSPSFIQRFSNNLSPNKFGIESIVNVLEISDQDIDTYPDRVKIDYVYFEGSSPSGAICTFNYPELDNYYLYLPNSSLDLYQLENLSSVDCS